MTNEFILNLENKLQGIGTRLKELHFDAPTYSLHKIIDEFTDEFREYEDALMENSQALWGFIKPGDLNPELPTDMEFEALLENIRGLLVGIKKESKDSMMWTGIINLTDEFFTVVNKYIYLTKIIKKRDND